LLPESESPVASEDSPQSNEMDNDMVELAAPLGPNAQEAVAEWFDSGSNGAGHQIMEDDEIVADTLGQCNSDSESEEEDNIEESLLVTLSQALNALETSLLWLETQNVDGLISFL
jgi:hypothetical protein